MTRSEALEKAREILGSEIEEEFEEMGQKLTDDVIISAIDQQISFYGGEGEVQGEGQDEDNNKLMELLEIRQAIG